ncbi:dihydroneopterin aldolase [Sulfurirhabdus autotrophica]|uniref:7,8-dihydroneopterin aldolase n=2 Tax=Sulfurirhabdus autotrophica TaxID=1706046 RepID=A0A4R3XVN5_9PROT|nr:dihydroneopterin aldolase [Sulfurirhabdus autotrophica]
MILRLNATTAGLQLTTLMDILFLREFKLDTIIGIYDWERKIPQTIQLDVEIGLPNSRACETDNVEDTIDYAKIVARIQETLAAKPFSLVEALAEHVAQLIINEFGSPWVKVSVAKLGLIRGIKQLGVVVERGSKG